MERLRPVIEAALAKVIAPRVLLWKNDSGARSIEDLPSEIVCVQGARPTALEVLETLPAGRELRLHQEYFFVSASVQDLLRRYRQTHEDFSHLPAKVSIHLNDTHPVLAIPELMRLLLDEHALPWDQAWALCQVYQPHANA